MARTHRRVGLLLALGLLSAACANVGQDFPTREQVRTWFGPPWRTGMEDGYRTWTYGRYRYSLFSPVRARDLVVKFDESGVVRSYTFNSTERGDLRGPE
jgi:hypothetical protein